MVSIKHFYLIFSLTLLNIYSNLKKMIKFIIRLLFALFTAIMACAFLSGPILIVSMCLLWLHIEYICMILFIMFFVPCFIYAFRKPNEIWEGIGSAQQ